MEERLIHFRNIPEDLIDEIIVSGDQSRFIFLAENLNAQQLYSATRKTIEHDKFELFKLSLQNQNYLRYGNTYFTELLRDNIEKFDHINYVIDNLPCFPDIFPEIRHIFYDLHLNKIIDNFKSRNDSTSYYCLNLILNDIILEDLENASKILNFLCINNKIFIPAFAEENNIVRYFDMLAEHGFHDHFHRMFAYLIIRLDTKPIKTLMEKYYDIIAKNEFPSIHKLFFGVSSGYEIEEMEKFSEIIEHLLGLGIRFGDNGSYTMAAVNMLREIIEMGKN